MTATVYSREQLMSSHDYAEPQIVAGQRCHGGFLADGRYVPPRSLVREPAIAAWTESLRARGGELMLADASLLDGVRYPSPAQQKLLLHEGLGQTFWNMLTITGLIEGRGRLLAELAFPEFQKATSTDISGWGLGHLNKGLLVAHGIDEGGEPDKGVGGHDTMWFALRDMAFGEVGYPEPEPPGNIGRDESDRMFPGLSEGIERTVEFLLNLLLIEFRAERGFALSQAMLRDPELFTNRREQALEAAEVVERIRSDERIHVESLRLYLGELRSLELDTKSGTVSGAEVIDSMWVRLVRWATVEQPPLAAAQQKQILTQRILAHPDGSRILAEFDALPETF